jgi:beta-galactosidase
MHHDNGLLGSAAFDRAEVRRVEIMRANGYNAIRCAHNPPSEVFLDACDRLGMLVIDEFTDMWESYKNPDDYSRFFRAWWKKDLTDMILRDRNHPGIILWSIGNEIPESSDTSGVRIGKQLAECVKSLDKTRPVTEAISEFLTPGGWENTKTAINILDVAGYNYMCSKYESDHKKYPGRIMVATESFPIDAYDYWKPVEKFPYVIGDFVWTAMDYFGEVSIGSASIVPAAQKKSSKIPEGFKIPEGVNVFDLMAKSPSVWPYFVSGCGDIDITGDKKPQKLYRDVLWDISKLEINVHTPISAGYAENVSMWGWPDEWPSWSWKGSEGKALQVRVFTKASRVRLELNGKVTGEKELLPEDKYIAVFEVPYQPGELKAVALENGKVVATQVLKTPGEPASIKLVADRNKIDSDRNDLSFVKIEVVDANGQLVPKDSIRIKLSVSGNGEIIASGNTNPRDMASVNRPQINSYKGRVLAIIRPTGSGRITLVAESDGLKTGEVIIEVTK